MGPLIAYNWGHNFKIHWGRRPVGMREMSLVETVGNGRSYALSKCIAATQLQLFFSQKAKGKPRLAKFSNFSS
jgi:hypothetical protein